MPDGAISPSGNANKKGVRRAKTPRGGVFTDNGAKLNFAHNRINDEKNRFSLGISAHFHVLFPVYGREELVIVQAISTSKKTFVVNKGQEDGINLNAEAIFSTEDTSIVCRALK